MPFIGKADIYDLQTMPYDHKVELSWKSYSSVPVTIYVATDNKFKEGGRDEWIKVAELPTGTNKYTIDLELLPTSNFYKFVVQAPGNHLNRWLKK